MKVNLFEILLSLFEKTLSQLKEKQDAGMPLLRESKLVDLPISPETRLGVEVHIVKDSSSKAMRIFSMDEQMKLTKASAHFLMKLSTLNLIPSQCIELIMNRLFFSDSRCVTLQETKWIIRSTLSQTLDPMQMAFLELMLYFKEDGLSLH